MHTHVPVVEGGGRVALCTTTGGSGGCGSRMSRRLDADEAPPEAVGPPAHDILSGGGEPEGEEGRAVVGGGQTGDGPALGLGLPGWGPRRLAAAPSRPLVRQRVRG